MVKAYLVSYRDESSRYTFPTPYLLEVSAKRHVDFLRQMRADDPSYDVIEIESISSQKILLDGDVVGYQFSRNTMGKRTVTRKVYDLTVNETGVIGKTTWKGRVLGVEMVLYGWKAVKMLPS